MQTRKLHSIPRIMFGSCPILRLFTRIMRNQRGGPATENQPPSARTAGSPKRLKERFLAHWSLGGGQAPLHRQFIHSPREDCSGVSHPHFLKCLYPPARIQ